jgi:hypothetical protein
VVERDEDHFVRRFHQRIVRDRISWSGEYYEIKWARGCAGAEPGEVSMKATI